jgi:hypothetical protein
VSHNHAFSTLAPFSVEIEISLACVIGEAVATAALTIAAGLDERRNGGLTLQTKSRCGDLIAALFSLHQKCAGDFDFYTVAHEYGKRALHARYIQAKSKMNGSCPQLSDAMCAEMADAMVEWPLEALREVIAAEMN